MIYMNALCGCAELGLRSFLLRRKIKRRTSYEVLRYLLYILLLAIILSELKRIVKDVLTLKCF